MRPTVPEPHPPTRSLSPRLAYPCAVPQPLGMFICRLSAFLSWLVQPRSRSAGILQSPGFLPRLNLFLTLDWL